MILAQPRNSTQYSISGSKTYRLASKMFSIKLTHPRRDGKVGANMQNIEKSMRVIYVPDVGYIFVQVDQSGAEAMIVAYCCRPGNYRDLFIYGVKPHCFVAMHVFEKVWRKELQNTGVNIGELINTPISKLKDNPHWFTLDKLIKSTDKWPSERRYYYIAKQICHASSYGMRSGMFQLNTLEKSKGRIVISKPQAEFYLTTFHGIFPEIHEWQRGVENQLNKTKTLYNLFGFPIEFWYPSIDIPENLLNDAYARIPQSTVACITRQAYIKTQNFIEDNRLDWHLMGDTHDSYVAQCLTGQERELARVMQDNINIELVSPYDGVKFRMKSEAVAGYNWCPSDKEKGYNLEGLTEILV